MLGLKQPLQVPSLFRYSWLVTLLHYYYPEKACLQTLEEAKELVDNMAEDTVGFYSIKHPLTNLITFEVSLVSKSDQLTQTKCHISVYNMPFEVDSLNKLIMENIFRNLLQWSVNM
jgi:hypothetical protein